MDLFKFARGQNFPPGTLYLVPTPIGNLADITIRALHILSQVDGIACEDKRHSSMLLNAYGISKPLYALHEHNEISASADLLEKLRNGERWAYISDAGTPGISDPGAILCAEVTKAGYQVSPLPGPSAITAAVSGSGEFLKHGNGGFQFLGFLPTKANQRDELLKLAATSHISSFFYEAPHRIESTLKFISTELDGERKVLIAKELSKIYEEIKVIAVKDLSDWMKTVDNWQGEYVLGLEGAARSDSPTSFDERTLQWISAINGRIGHKELSEIISQITGVSKKDAYRELIEKKES
jgi:16S rRNA (cytidine1402-2'-O)-methyltransferase